ncbi:hypothetical protein [Aureimonas sp. AU12]|uniref:hypothetical protein n=1 Tax=Aureimonas sp. AU12 TaxID=1638161 RepID=UPI000AA76305|nr:hypothetical protein [Aureimonas sp. AU12]
MSLHLTAEYCGIALVAPESAVANLNATVIARHCQQGVYITPNGTTSVSLPDGSNLQLPGQWSEDDVRQAINSFRGPIGNPEAAARSTNLGKYLFERGDKALETLANIASAYPFFFG